MLKKEFLASAIQMQCHVGSNALALNLEKAEHYVNQASKLGVDLVVLPEAFNYGYNLDQAQLLATVDSVLTRQALGDWAKKYNVSISAGVIEKDNNQIFNRTVFITPQGLSATYEKIHLFKLGSADETQAFTPGQQRKSYQAEFGPLGFLICYDLRFPELARALALDGVQTLLVSSAWGYGRRQHFRLLQQARAIENQIFLISAGQVGENYRGGLKFSGHSVILDPLGTILAEANDIEEKVLIAAINLNQIDVVRKNMNCLADRVPHTYRNQGSNEAI